MYTVGQQKMAFSLQKNIVLLATELSEKEEEKLPGWGQRKDSHHSLATLPSYPVASSEFP